MTLRPAEDIRPGDAIVFLGVEHRVSRVEKYVGPLAEAFSIAYDSRGWCITLVHGDLVEVAT